MSRRVAQPNRLARLRIEPLEARYCLSAVSFVPREINDVADRPQTNVVAGDFDDDGDVDLVAHHNSFLDVMENDGSGDFTFRSVPRRTMPFESQTSSLRLYSADIDGDAAQDLVIRESVGATQMWYHWRGLNDLRQIGEFDDEPINQLMDYNRDGAADLIVFDNLTFVVGTGNVADVSVRLNDGSGAFGVANFLISVPFSHTLLLADLDSDDDTDILHGAPLPGVLGQPRFVENSQESFISTDRLPFTPRWVEDIDGDGDLDLIGFRQDGVQFWREHLGDLVFGDEQLFSAEAASQGWFYDLDGDGDLDAIAINRQGSLVSLENRDGGFAQQTLIANDRPNFATAADLDGDGDLDIVTQDSDFNTSWFQSDAAIAVSGDVNGDLRVDFMDFVVLSLNYRKENATRSDGDLDGDGVVSFADALILSHNFGRQRG